MTSAFLLQRFTAASGEVPWDNEETIRSELFSIERLEQHARSLAAAQSITLQPTPVRSLNARLRENAKILLEAHRAIAAAVTNGAAITPSAEWLLDNQHVVEEQVRQIFEDLPPGYYRQLPKVAEGPFAGYPRVFGLAWAFVAHTDSHFDGEALRRFLRAYQTQQPLTIGELWAVAITLRIVLVENLRRAARRIEMSRAGRIEADALADLVLGPRAADVRLALERLEGAPIAAAFAVQLVHRLRDHGTKSTRVIRWLEERLALQQTSVDRVVHDEHLSQGGTNVTVRNIITSMRRISDVDWADIVEGVSLVDEALRRASRFGEMDFATRNLYRNAIEELARYSDKSELDVTYAAIAAAARTPATEPEHDPGFYLISGGRDAFEKMLGFRAPLSQWPRRFNAAAGMPGLIAIGITLSVVILSVPILAIVGVEMDTRHLLLLALLGALPALDASIALVNVSITREMRTTPLPGFELRNGIPTELRTIIAVPMLLTDRETVDELIDRLEVHHLASDEGDLYFALLSDWTDAASETTPADSALLDAAARGIARLNERYGPGIAGPRFHLLHRRRIWNERQRRWIGWERKRGKLHELNRLLRGDTNTTFIALEGRPPRLPGGVRYVITLDSDTRLPRDAVRRSIGKMAHPLNQPRFDPELRRVVDGYGVLQPRVTPALPLGRQATLFQQAFSNASGIDPYAFTVSDVYQDLFGEGSYVGKGIYDIDAFERSLAGRVPENTVLSHDLFEGSFARAGFVSDIELVEEFPSQYLAAAARQHRWARGDWQLLPWLFGREGATPIGRRAASLPSIGRWKMTDNLRRSLNAPASIAALCYGWTLSFHDAAIWTAFVLATVALPMLFPIVAGMRRVPAAEWRSYVNAIGSDVRLAGVRVGLLFALLAHQSWLMVDAITRTLFRLVVTHRHLLDWVTAAQARLSLGRRSLANTYRGMAGGTFVALLVGAIVVAFGQGGLSIALPFVVLWLVAPAIAHRISHSTAETTRELSSEEAKELRLVARHTWRYFETFVTEKDNWLPPDNFQELPKPAIATRTSPTNIGLYLLAAATARDFGWLGTIDLLDRLERTLATMNALPRVRGHFMNWYDTRTLHRLEPQYISSVDSGNLVGHLIALANACTEWIDAPTDEAVIFAGIDDALAIARPLAAGQQPLEGAIDAFVAKLTETRRERGDLLARLAALEPLAVATVAVAPAAKPEANDVPDVRFWVEAAERTLKSHRRDLVVDRDGVVQRLHAVERMARDFVMATDFSFLLDRERNLLSIGYRVNDAELDPNCYDLLASEARLASFLAIAKADVPAKHWFRLGRAVTSVKGGAALVSWSGSMFEYLMPSLVMRAPIGSLLENTSRLVVRHQIAYATKHGVPWGISESAHNVRDLEFTYQYTSFGVPGLGLKRGLGETLVIAPYATALAAMVDAAAAARNFVRLAEVGGRGRYGYYDALDYTPSRKPKESDVAIVHTYMAHHQGMTVVALADALLRGEMRSRFHAEPIVQATELLLQERRPRHVIAAYPAAEKVVSEYARELHTTAPRFVRSVHTPTPETQLLSNGRYSVMLSAAGSGYSRWHDISVTRWREDPTRDNWGTYIYLRDVQTNVVWSAGYQPTGVEADHYEVTFTEDRATITRRDGELTTSLDVVVSTEDDAEVRRVTVHNDSRSAREIELTSYAEVVLATSAADDAHPTFSKMFVRTERDEEFGALLATRARRSPDEAEVWAAHFAIVEGGVLAHAEFETDRARFLGRGRDTRRPTALTEPLSGTTGTVLDPVFAVRRLVRIPAQGSVRVAFWTVVAPTRDVLLDLIDKQHDPSAFDRAATLAWTQGQVQLNHLGLDADEAGEMQRLASRLLYADAAFRPPPELIRRSVGAQPALWSQGISGDLPILLLRVDDIADLPLVRQTLRAHDYWRMKRLAVDVVILNERGASYVQDVQVALEALVRTSEARRPVGTAVREGRVYVVRADLITPETRGVLLATARIALTGRQGSITDQLSRLGTAPVRPVPLRPRTTASTSDEPTDTIASPPALERFNGLGGFADGGREYVVTLDDGARTPAPWINVVANPHFGFQVSSEGSGYTWSQSSKENQLTPWSNDPVSDPAGEALYVRDEATGEFWSPTVAPFGATKGQFVARHGQGYSRFQHRSHGIALDLTQFVPLADPVKISVLTVRNTSARARRLSATAYAEWVLGPSRRAGALSIVTDLDSKTRALFARNPWNATFGSRVAFADLAGRQLDWTTDRCEFLGRHGSLERPAALLSDAALSRTTGAGIDPCAALRTTFELAPGESTDIVVLLGQAGSVADARVLVARYRALDHRQVLDEVREHWNAVLGQIEIETPDRAMDLLLNRWGLYQTLACRVWARAAFYQASGAYGFRDQLQDCMALACTRPDITREHLLRAASRQFREGDVQHWWLPPTGQGVRTRISDDRAWLAYAAAHYVETTGDAPVLDEMLPFLEGPTLTEGAHDAFFLPQVSEENGSLFEHCARALDASLTFGKHGLPLIGTGDWNDGMNRVGPRGEGESVWLAWLLHAALSAFMPFAAARGERDRIREWTAAIAALEAALENCAWDGEWYRRAYFDDGTPLGSAVNDACRIDSIAQSWSVISGVAGAERANAAMTAVDRHLVRRDERLLPLFTPPFDGTTGDPGYIAAYPPGVRENGGQYTHAGAWAVIANARLGRGDAAAELFSFLNPIARSSSRELAETYKVEPYAVAADVYSEPPHVGRGGWTWYTGSAAWLYRAGIESILGIRIRGQVLSLAPCVPRDWPGFRATVRFRSALYRIDVRNPAAVCGGIAKLTVDDEPHDTADVALADDGREHRIDVVLGRVQVASSPEVAGFQ